MPPEIGCNFSTEFYYLLNRSISGGFHLIGLSFGDVSGTRLLLLWDYSYANVLKLREFHRCVLLGMRLLHGGWDLARDIHVEMELFALRSFGFLGYHYLTRGI